ncbi:MAG TPA: hypothetical protein VN641_04415 [Urbifossiella sp.]|nr:hypothetical protein [Urbifossiella sp.]
MHQPSRRRFWLGLALALPPILLFLNAAAAQRIHHGPVISHPRVHTPAIPHTIVMPHNRVMPHGGQTIHRGPIFINRLSSPRVETVWVCTKCGRRLGSGAMPSFVSCPTCSASLRSLPPSAVRQEMEREQAEEASGSDPLMIVIAVVGGIIAVGGAVSLFVLAFLVLRK